MKTKTQFQSGFLGSRALIAFLVCASAACSLLASFLGPATPANVLHRTLTFPDRVAYQRAIEDVYWRHRIWPKENLYPKPSLDEVIPAQQIEKKVEDYLRNSQALENWQQPITTEQLQAEMDRMAQHTKQPEVLHELFQALGNDPFVVAECLARPVLVDRFLTEHKGGSAAPRAMAVHAAGWEFLAASRLALSSSSAYKLPEINAPNGCIDDRWTPTSPTNAPTARYAHTEVWTGSEMIVWGGRDANLNLLNTGGRYNPSTDSWTPTSTTNAPSGRELHTAIWTGTEMIVWGGNSGGSGGGGGRYNPATDTWTSTSSINAPITGLWHTAVWTGSEMIVWGGSCCVPQRGLNTGGRYNPSTDSWTATSTTNAPAGRWFHTAVWTDNEMIIWGGNTGGITNTGGRYNPSTDSWAATSTANAPSARDSHTAVWTDSEMIVWGGRDLIPEYTNTGGRYNPNTNSWTATSTTNAPEARLAHTAVWTGTEMIVWGGIETKGPPVNTGGRYNPGTDSWTATGTTNAPSGRYFHTAIRTDIEMIVWGGCGDIPCLNPLLTGGRYCAQSGSTPTPTPTPSATATATATVTPTATVTVTPTATATPSSTTTPNPTPTPSPIPRATPTPRARPTPAPRP